MGGVFLCPRLVPIIKIAHDLYIAGYGKKPQSVLSRTSVGNGYGA